ncbi:amino acid adenylation domain-containing protein [Hymenobacter rubripertinctus]|uniref:Amino acid adenylation domain-containing protein n=1 Tax=Hymenobacter rubripertinctus TaxID=2029981 RepID=A0A418QK46_9BACT|nr:amino acid adenylation domain-containing protein [Hymenobacter rubripertinctus]
MTVFDEQAGQYSEQNPVLVNHATDLAYVIYTSGSTGNPKGCMLQHSSVCNFLHSMKLAPGITEDDIVMAVTTISFDIAVTEIFLPLVNGAAVLLVEQEAQHDPYRLQAIINQQHPTIVQATPSLWNMLISSGWAGSAQLKALCGGEALSKELSSELLKRCGELWNMYGPTETTVWSLIQQITPQTGLITIGKPIANTQVYVLSASGELMPLGIIGEICIGGAGLARGYLNKEELTAENFVENPFIKGEKLYRTGDLGRWLPDGTIEYVGRKDYQVKVRGYRIELGEIESALNSYPAIVACVAVATPNASGEKDLVAYIVSGQPVAVADVRSWLAGRLPAYMVPGYFVQLPELPLTPNGKTDRSKLPAYHHHSAQPTIVHVPARNVAEEKMAAIWQSILGQENIGITDNFFELGGHSLKALRLLQAINSREPELGIRIQDIYNRPTIEALLQQKAESSRIIRLNRDTTSANNIYLIPPILGNSILYKQLADMLNGEYNCYGLQYSGLEQGEPLYSSVETAAQELSQQIIQHQQQDDFVLLAYSMGAPIAFEMVKILESKFNSIDLVLVDSQVNQQSVDKTAEPQEIQWLLDQYRAMLPGHDADEKRLHGFLANNYRILHKYQQQGRIKSPIWALEAQDTPFRTQMEEWSEYTAGGTTHNFLVGNHWQALSEANLPQLRQVLLALAPPKAQEQHVPE